MAELITLKKNPSEPNNQLNTYPVIDAPIEPSSRILCSPRGYLHHFFPTMAEPYP